MKRGFYNFAFAEVAAAVAVGAEADDAAGRRIEIARSGTAMSESRTDAYGYNVRNELTSATKTGGPQSPAAEYAYQYDDIGNRITSTDLATNRTYTANNLNQYTLISNLCDSASMREEFVPQFDDDGNQTLIQTSTGIWSVQYNGENRPVLWTGGTPSAATNIVMSFDRMGRRVEYRETQTTSASGGNTATTTLNTHHRFVYDDYLCILRINGASNNAMDFMLGWDPSETSRDTAASLEEERTEQPLLHARRQQKRIRVGVLPADERHRRAL